MFEFLSALVSAFACFGFLGILIPRLRSRFLDQPNQRSSHIHPIPRGGGIVFVVVASFASALNLWLFSGTTGVPWPLVCAPLLALPLSLVGLLDDRNNLPASWRFSIQIVTASVFTFASHLVTSSLGLFLLIAIIVTSTAIINFVNFMDGVDGLVAGCMAVSLTASAVQLAAPWPTWALVGALVGFLFWNWSPAKVFMGDVGSTFLGAVFCVLVLQSKTWTEALALLLVATPLLADAFFCVFRRLLVGQPVFKAHRLHLFQRLHQAGWPHSRVSIFYISSTALLAIAFLWNGLIWVIPLAVVELLIGVWLDQQVAVPFAVASRD